MEVDADLTFAVRPARAALTSVAEIPYSEPGLALFAVISNLVTSWTPSSDHRRYVRPFGDFPAAPDPLASASPVGGRHQCCRKTTLSFEPNL
jgi:hypothetical protein